MSDVFDIAIIGGGINGCGCAADAALRGLSVALFEQDDLAAKTSSSSTKLIHGGLRYLEYYEFKLVKKALAERQILLNQAPHLVHAQEFVLPYQPIMRPAWLLRLGLFLYDHLSIKNKLPHCKSISRSKSTFFNPLKKIFTRGFIFYDAAADDARLTLANALQAKQHGALINPRQRVIKAEISDNLWHLTIQPKAGSAYTIQAKALINACGPWVKSTAQLLHIPQEAIALVKGSHIVVPKLYEGTHAYVLQHEDQRIVFAIPFQGYTMIGTTDVPVSEPCEHSTITEHEIKYLLDLTNTYFNQNMSRQDIIYSWSGIRALLNNKNKNASALSRDYEISLTQHTPPLITILGGKITTYRQLAEECINALHPFISSIPPSKTAHTALPGSSYNSMTFNQYCTFAKEQYSWLEPTLLQRYLTTYGTNTEHLLDGCDTITSLGECFGAQLYAAELNYLMRYEWAYTAEDVLLRRTKLGLSIDEKEIQKITSYMEKNRFISH